MTKTLFAITWAIVATLAVLVALASARYLWLSLEVAAPPDLLAGVSQKPFIFYAHITGGTIALFVGAWNFLQASRRRFVFLHRWLGRVYLVSVFVGGLAGLSLATTAQGGLAGQIGFGMLAVLWLATAAMAYYRVKNYDIALHRQWMIRNYALTFAAVTLRIWIPLLIGVAGYDFQEGYAAIAWLSWVPNLIAAEFILRRPVEL